MGVDWEGEFGVDAVDRERGKKAGTDDTDSVTSTDKVYTKIFNGYTSCEESQRAVKDRFLTRKGDEGVERFYGAICFCRDIKGGECLPTVICNCIS
jgi:hypothetical protein